MQHADQKNKRIGKSAPPEFDKQGLKPQGTHPVLSELHQRFEQLEQELTQRLQRVEQAEQQLQQTRQDLEAQKEAFSTDRDANDALAQQLADTQEQLTQHEARVRDQQQRINELQTAEQELTASLEEARNERDEAMESLSEVRRELQSYAQRMRTQLVEAYQHGSATEDEDVRHEFAPLDLPSASVGNRSRLILPIACLLVAAALSIWAYQSYQPRYEITGVLQAQGDGREALLAAAERLEETNPALRVRRPSTQEAFIHFSLLTQNPTEARSRINEIGREVVDNVNTSMAASPTTMPADVRSSALLADMTSTDDTIAVRLEQALDTIEAEQSRVRSSLNELNDLREQKSQLLETLQALQAEREEALPDDMQQAIPRDALNEALAADTNLQAVREELDRRQSELKEMLSSAAELDMTLLENAGQHASDALALTAEEDRTAYSLEIQSAIDAIEEELTRVRELLATLEESWQQVSGQLSEGDVDLLQVQKKLSTLAQTFAEQSSAARVVFETQLQRISEGTDQPTKGLVLRRKLARAISPVLESLADTSAQTSRVVLTDNLELSAMMHRVAGLQRQISDRRMQIEDALRREMLADQLAENQASFQERKQTLTSKIAEVESRIEEELSELPETMKDVQAGESLRDAVQLQAERSEKLQEWIDQLQQEQPAEPGGSSVVFAGSMKRLAESPQKRIVRAVLWGAGCLLVYLLISIVIHAVRASKSTAAEMDMYTEQLRQQKQSDLAD